MITSQNWVNDEYLTCFIVGNKYITVLHAFHPFEDVVQAVLDEAGDKKTPFVILSSTVVRASSVIIDNELAQIMLGY